MKPVNFFRPHAAGLSLCVSAASLLAIASPAIAADATLLPPVTVVASRHPGALATTPAAVTVLDAADLARDSTRPLEDILFAQAGIAVGRSGGPGQQTGLFLRGSESDGLLVLVDGVRINSATISGANLQNLRGADLQRVEIVRGPRSTLYGSEAIGGVISITTRRSRAAEDVPTESLRLRAETGSDDSTQMHASAARFTANGHVAFSAGRIRTDGDQLIEPIPVSGRHENASHTLNASTRFDVARIGIDALDNRGVTQYLDTFSAKAQQQEFHNGSLSLWSSLPAGDAVQLDFRASQAQDRIVQRQSRDFVDSLRHSGLVSLTHEAEGNLFVTGLELEREEADTLIYGLPTTDADDNRAIFLRDEWRRGRHLLSAGARATEYDSFGGHTTSEASWGLQFAQRGFGWLSWGLGFHAPTGVDRYGYGGNPALRPERSESFEAGARQGLGNWQFTLTGFRQDIDELMLCVALPPPSWDCVMQNVASARITGTELAGRWRQQNTQLDFNLTLLDPVDQSAGERLSRRPEKQFAATATQRLASLELSLRLLALDRRDNSAFDTLQLPGFATLDIGARWLARRELAVEARIENAGDKHYALAASRLGPYLMPDRAYFLGIEWTPAR